MDRCVENNDLYFVDVPQVSDAEMNADELNDESFSRRLPAPPAPADEEDASNNDNANNEDNQNTFFAELEDVPMANANKKKSINRGPKLDPNLLMGARGLPALRAMTHQLKFKGVDHEYEDLNLLMSKLEHWAHRLYPKYTFTDTLEKLETLSGKAQIKTAMERMRMGMPLINDETQQSNKDGPDGGEDSEIEYDENEPQAPSFVSVYGNAPAMSGAD